MKQHSIDDTFTVLSGKALPYEEVHNRLTRFSTKEERRNAIKNTGRAYTSYLIEKAMRAAIYNTDLYLTGTAEDICKDLDKDE